MNQKEAACTEDLSCARIRFRCAGMRATCVVFCCILLPAIGNTQSFVDRLLNKLSSKNGVFENNEVMNIQLKGSVREVFNDRAEKPQYHPLILSYKTEDSNDVSIPIEVQTRGHFRKAKENCGYPPLLLHFLDSKSLSSTVFKGQDKLKLVMPCSGEEYIIREWLVYEVYNLVTPKSFRARLVKLQIDSEKKKKPVAPFFGILLEDEQQMAKRNKVISVKRKLKPEQTEVNTFLKMAVFEYLIGNTDWSVQYRQNIKLLAADSDAVAIPVPYDFDHAGIVNTPYAKPAEELNMTSVRERRYRGYCVTDMAQFEDVIDFYNKIKVNIYNVYTSCPLLNEKYVKTTIKYLDEFYETINNPKSLKQEFGYPCDKTGTGNVVIKGLKKQD